MSNMNIGFALLFSLLFSTSPLYAGNGMGAHGPVSQDSGMEPGPQPGPGPGHMNRFGPGHDAKNLAYYGDWDSNRVFIIDVDNMALLEIVEDTGDGPYGCDQQDASTAYALTRKTESLTVIDNHFFENIGKILLDHKPRSTHHNSDTGFSLVSGADKVMTSLIWVNNNKVTKVFGVDKEAIPGNSDFGGSLTTGHPLWIDDENFFMLDRAHREIQLWSRHGGRVSTLNTPTSVHHIFQSPLERFDEIYYAVVEGNQGENRSPSILRFRIQNRKMVVTGEAILSNYDGAPDPDVMGSHHADFHPDGVHIYIGSAEGHVFVVNKNTMDVETMINTGKGSGHTTFVPMHNVAFVTNHNDTYMTVIDTIDHIRLGDIEVASTPPTGYKSQSHTSGVSTDQRYFYSAASYDGVFFRIDVEKLVDDEVLEISELDIEDELEHVLGLDNYDVNILMGSFIWDGEGDNM